VPGLAIRVLGPFADRVYLPMGIRVAGVRAGAALHAGLPVRREIVRTPAAAAREAIGLDPRQRALVILGGSQGASALNAWARSQFESLASENIQVYCVTGLGKGEKETITRRSKTGETVKAVFVPFSDSIGEVLSAADLVITRAGAGTLAELIRCEVPAILIPYPHAASDHQRANAAFFERQGGGLVVEESALGGLHSEVMDLIFNEWLLRQFRGNLKRMDRSNALELMIADLEAIAGAGSRGTAGKSGRDAGMRAKPLQDLFGMRVSRIHCLGVGGMGVAPLAIYLARSGWMVSGEDDALTPEVSSRLGKRRRLVVGPPRECDLVVRSSAISDAHPSCASALARGTPVVRRGELLAEVSKGHKLVAVCGSHGKTTTTAMLVTALRHARFPAGYVSGGLFNDDTPPAGVGSNEWLVAEIDESDGTIEAFSPEITVLVNLDWDHPDRYASPAEIEAAFAALCARTRGRVLVSDASALSLRLAPWCRDLRKDRRLLGKLLGREAEGDARRCSSGASSAGPRHS
jgi:UDP-N-acetylglucosamine transferase subunit ALG13